MPEPATPTRATTAADEAGTSTAAPVPGGPMFAPARLPEGHELALRVTPMPADVNANGDVFGGWVMAQVDVAGGVTAARRARGRVVTVAVNAFQFRQPVSVGDLVSFYTRVESTGRTSITVHVLVTAERDPQHPVTVRVTEATLTYVAIDAQGRKREVPPEHAAAPAPRPADAG